MKNRNECELTPTEGVNGATGCSEDEICCSRTPCQVKNMGEGYCTTNDQCAKLGEGYKSVSDEIYKGDATGCRHLKDDVRCCVKLSPSPSPSLSPSPSPSPSLSPSPSPSPSPSLSPSPSPSLSPCPSPSPTPTPKISYEIEVPLCSTDENETNNTRTKNATENLKNSKRLYCDRLPIPTNGIHSVRLSPIFSLSLSSPLTHAFR